MAGFLKNLQKSKSGFDLSVNDLLTGPSYLPSVGEESEQAPPPPSPPPEEEPPNENITQDAAAKIEEELQNTEALLAELAAESEKQIAAPAGKKKRRPPESSKKLERKTAVADKPSNKTGSVRIPRKKRRVDPAPALSGGAGGKLPWWLTDGNKSTPQVEMLVPQARKMLNEILPSSGEMDVDLPVSVRQAVDLAAQMLSEEVRITEHDREASVKELLNLLTGKGPLQPLFDDPSVTDIFIDGHRSIKVIRRGQAIETPFYFRSPEEYRAYVTNMLQSVDRVLNLSSPIVDCALDDEYRCRLNAVDSSVLDSEEPRVCIRVPRLQKVSFYDILHTKTLPATLAAWLAELVASGLANILVLGPTGCGKTVMTTALLSAVGSDERIITIEDVPEIFVPSAHLEKMISRPANAQGQGEIKMPHLLKAALRRAPHRIVVGEIRDEEGQLFLRALETGHAGSIATIHAENPQDGLWRLLDVVSSYESAPQESIMRRIGRALHIMISLAKVEGRPCLMEVAEVRPPVNGEFVVLPLVKFNGMVDGKRQWRLMTQTSNWIEEVKERGLDLRPGPGLLPPEMPETKRGDSKL